MKIIALGDIHGRNIWKEIVAKEEKFDKIIFIGDYFDTHDNGHSGNRQIENFKDILEFKKANMDKVILLTGNHDFHYIRGISETYSGYQAAYAIDIGAIIQEALNADLLQMCYIQDNFVFSHAGITKTWSQSILGTSSPNTDVLQELVNDMFKYQPNVFKFTMGANFSNTGNDITQTPIWVRPEALYKDKLDGLNFIVGHTSVTKLDVSNQFNIILIDCLGTSKEYLVIEDGVLSVAK